MFFCVSSLEYGSRGCVPSRRRNFRLAPFGITSRPFGEPDPHAVILML